MWSGERLTQIQVTTRPDDLWLEIWIGMSKSSPKARTARMGYREAKARQCSKTERNVFHRSGRRRVKKTLKAGERNSKLETCFGSGHALQDGNEKAFVGATGTVAGENTHSDKETKYACVVEPHESTRKRLESTLRQIRTITSQRKVQFTSP